MNHEPPMETTSGPEHLIRIVGEMDVANVHRLRELLDAIDDPEPHIVLELADLTFMDSSGLGVLLERMQRGGTITLRNPSDIIRRVVDATGLTDVLRLEP